MVLYDRDWGMDGPNFAEYSAKFIYQFNFELLYIYSHGHQISFFSPKASLEIFFLMKNAAAIKMHITPTTMKAMERK